MWIKTLIFTMLALECLALPTKRRLRGDNSSSLTLSPNRNRELWKESEEKDLSTIKNEVRTNDLQGSFFQVSDKNVNDIPVIPASPPHRRRHAPKKLFRTRHFLRMCPNGKRKDRLGHCRSTWQ